MRDFFTNDLARRGGGINAALARAVYGHCIDDLKANVHYPARRAKRQDERPYHTILRIAGIDRPFLAIDLDARNRLRLDFPDNGDSIHEFGAVWHNGDRGKAVKKEKYVDLASDPSAAYQKSVLDLVDRIYKNTANYYASR